MFIPVTISKEFIRFRYKKMLQVRITYLITSSFKEHFYELFIIYFSLIMDK